MLLQLEDDQAFLRDTTARFLADKVPPATLRDLRDDPAGHDRQYWRQGTELGWTSLLVSEEHGGGSVSGSGLVDLSLVAYAFGAAAAPGPLLSTAIVAGALSRAGGHQELLAELLAGTAIATWGYGEPPPDHQLGAVSTTVRRTGDLFVVDGVKRPVESAAESTHLLVTGRSASGLTQVLVPIDSPGVSIEPMHSVDLTRRFSVVRFDSVQVPVESLVGPEHAADVDTQLDQALVLSCAESVGAMQTAFDMTVQWAFDRYSFGRPLASYQALKHRFADMAVWLQASHAITDEATAAVSAGRSDGAKLASAAKAYVGTYGSELIQDCVQLHGGIGVTFEHDLHLYLRRHTLNRGLWGTPAEHHRRLAALHLEAAA